jgi:hypothetical protein
MTVLPEDVYFIEAVKGRNQYSFDLCDRCYKKLFKDVKKRQEDYYPSGDYDDEDEDNI